VDVVLGDAAACFSVLKDGAIVVLRSRRRDTSAGEAGRLVQEAERAARPVENGDGRRAVVLSGSDAARLSAEAGLAREQPPALAGIRQWPEAAEAAWLRGLLS
jgi:hypothetical protein